MLISPSGCIFVGDLEFKASSLDRLISAVIAKRQELRAAKQYTEADMLRDLLRSANVVVEDVL